MVDLVKRLRADALPGDRQYQREARTTLWSERQEAADRIENLETALIDIKAITMEYPIGFEIGILIREFARKALEGKDD